MGICDTLQKDYGNWNSYNASELLVYDTNFNRVCTYVYFCNYTNNLHAVSVEGTQQSRIDVSNCNLYNSSPSTVLQYRIRQQQCRFNNLTINSSFNKYMICTILDLPILSQLCKATHIENSMPKTHIGEKNQLANYENYE